MIQTTVRGSVDLMVTLALAGLAFPACSGGSGGGMASGGAGGTSFGEIELYINGSMVGLASAPGAIVPSGNPLQFGRDPANPNTRSFQGLIDEVSIYNRALSAAEVQQLYAAGGAGKCGAQGGD